MLCKGPLWERGDFTSCYRHSVFESIPLSVAVLVSVILITSQLRNFKRRSGKLLSGFEHTYGTITGENENDIVIIPVSTSDRVKTAIEILCLVGQIGLVLTKAHPPASSDKPPIGAILIFWSYCLLIAALRGLGFGGGLWYHSAVLYPMVWLLTIIPLRTSIITGVNFLFYAAEFVIATAVLSCVWTSRRGDGPTCIPVTPGLNPSPETFASISQLISFSWVDDILWNGYWRTIYMEQVPDLHHDDHAYKVMKEFDRFEWTDNIFRPCLNMLKWRVLLTGVYAMVHACLTLIPALLVKFILDYIDNPDESYSSTAWTSVFALLFFAVLATCVESQALYLSRKNAVHVRLATQGKIYNKLLKRNVVSHSSSSSTGSIINLMSIDSNNFSEVFARLHCLFGSLFQIVFAMGGLYLVMGWSAIVGAAACVASVPINTWIMNGWMKYHKLVLEKSDERISKTNELLQCIQIIKLFAWEDKFSDQVRELREQELAMIKKRLIIWSAAIAVSIGTPMAITVSAFTAYTMFAGHVLTSPVAFTSLTLFTMLQVPIKEASDTVGSIMGGLVSLNRMNRFLNETETTKYEQLAAAKLDHIGFENNAVCRWGGANGFALRDLDIRFKKGKLNMITGPTGSGKTSLLMALLGEMSLESGKVYLTDGLPAVRGCYSGVAYCAQQPWLLNDTIKANILFSSEYDEERYRAVIDACALRRDLEILSGGDSTFVGEKGIVLSGGQKQRISLARAVYSKADTLLLDDCLSAVDSDTAVYLYDKCLTGPLVKNRTVVMVSHNVGLTLSKADFVVVLKNGRVVEQGPPKDVHAKPQDDLQKEPANPSEEETAPQEPDGGEQLVQEEEEEERATGVVEKDVYLLYFKFCGNKWFWMGLAVAFAIENSFKFGHNFWVRNWALGIDNRSPEYYLAVYVGIGVIAVLCTFLEVAYLMAAMLRASRRIFDKLLDSVMGANSRFFDNTPLGRIMNRFSKDIGSLDQELPPVLEGVFHFTFTALLTLIVIIAVTPAFIPLGVVIACVYSAIATFYLASSRELKRMDSITRSPIYQHYGQSLSGVSTIRAYGHCDRFMAQNLAHINYNARSYMLMWATNRWLYFRIQVVGAVVSFGAGAFVMLSLGKIDSGLAGISMTYALSFNELVLWMVRMYADLEMGMNGMERAKQWMDLPAEKQDGAEPPLSWPEHGEIEFDKLSLRYAPHLPQVIKNVSLNIPAQTRVGIVGRTGSGKSTIMTALFRNLEADSGCIRIDGMDISELALKPLRRALAIIPQDPTLFSGTLRTNLDPFGDYSDLQMFEALRRVHLLTDDDDEEAAVAYGENENQFRNLDSAVTEHGQNLSQGQRQLVCLARAMLKKPKILMMDEATASIDYDTDAKIQKTIREEFGQCTLITIAHRLKSIMDYDRILVLDNGSLVQYDAPRTLIEQRGGSFRDLCEKSGHFDELVGSM